MREVEPGAAREADPGLPVRGEVAARAAAFLVHEPAWGPDAFHRRRPEALLFREPPDPERYAAQHRAFLAALGAEGACVVPLHAVVGDHPAFARTRTRPNQVFTRDSLLTFPWAPGGYVAARLRPAQRRAEAATLAAAAERLGLVELARLPADRGVHLEGGDVVPFVRGGRRTLLAGYGPRSSAAGVRALRERLVPGWADEILAVRLAPWRLNLDGGFLPVAEDVVVAERQSVLGATLLDARGEREVDLWQLLALEGVDVVEVSREESIHAQACNAVCVGERRILCYDRCERVVRELARRDVAVVTVPGSELVKGRGGPRCMSRPVYGAPGIRAGATGVRMPPAGP